MIRVLIVRNADYRFHPSFKRTIDSFVRYFNTDMKISHEDVDIIVVNHNRDSENNCIKIEYEKYKDYSLKITTIHSKKTEGAIDKVRNLSYYGSQLKKVFNDELKNHIDLGYIYDYDSARFLYKKFDQLGIPFVYHIADFYADSRIKRHLKNSKIIYNLFKRFEHKVMKLSASSIICTEERYEQISPYNEDNVHVVHNTPIIPIDFEFNDKVTKPLNERFRIGYVGTLSDERHIKDLVNLVSEDKRFLLEIAGHGPVEDVVSQYAEKFENIKFYGKIPYNDMFNLYGRVDYIWGVYDNGGYNTRYSAPNKFYESLLLQTPMIALKGTSVDLLVNRHKTGIILENINSISDLYKIIEKVPYRVLVENCKQTHHLYSWEKQVETLNRIYNTILEEKGAAM